MIRPFYIFPDRNNPRTKSTLRNNKCSELFSPQMCHFRFEINTTIVSISFSNPRGRIWNVFFKKMLVGGSFCCEKLQGVHYFCILLDFYLKFYFYFYWGALFYTPHPQTPVCIYLCWRNYIITQPTWTKESMLPK